MFDFLSGNYLWHLIAQADFLSKLVLLILVIMSVMCWAILLYKLALLKVKRQHLQEAQKTLSTVHTAQDLMQSGQLLQGTVPGYFVQYGSMIVKTLLNTPHREKQNLDEKDFELLQSSLDQALQDLLQKEEELLPVLATSAAAAPLIGLFGTVWGLIHAFVRIAERQSADITTVAPGIAEALITTLAGLVVAIPAMIMYHYLQLQVRKNELALVSLADRFEWIVKSSLMK